MITQDSVIAVKVGPPNGVWQGRPAPKGGSLAAARIGDATLPKEIHGTPRTSAATMPA